MDVADGNVLSRRGSSTPPATAGKLAGAHFAQIYVVILLVGVFKYPFNFPKRSTRCTARFPLLEVACSLFFFFPFLNSNMNDRSALAVKSFIKQPQYAAASLGMRSELDE